jgi:ankyrin repeat protein
VGSVVIASYSGHLAVVQALLAAGADKDAKTENGCTALYIASLKGHLAVVEALLAAGADKEAKKREASSCMRRLR